MKMRLRRISSVGALFPDVAGGFVAALSNCEIEAVGSIFSIRRAEGLREGGQRARLNDRIDFYRESGALETRPYRRPPDRFDPAGAFFK